MTSRRTLDTSLGRRIEMKTSGSQALRHTRMSPPTSRSRDRSPDKSPGYSFQSVIPIDDIGAVFSNFPQAQSTHGSVADYNSFVNHAESTHPFMNTTVPDRTPNDRGGQSPGVSLSHTALGAAGPHITFSPASPSERPNYLQAPPRPSPIPQGNASQHQQTRFSLHDINSGVTSLAPRQIQQSHYTQSPPYTSQAPLFMRPPHSNQVSDHQQSTPLYQPQMHNALGQPFSSDTVSGGAAIGNTPTHHLPLLTTGQYSSVEGELTVDGGNIDDAYIMAAARAADRAKLAHRTFLKEAQRAREANAQRSGLPLSAKDKERERSRRESAVTRKRAEVYIAELERVARRVPALERRLANLQAEQLALQTQLASRHGSHAASPPSDVSPVSTNAAASERLPP